MGFLDFLRSNATPPLIRQSLADMQIMLDIAGEIFEAATAYALDNETLKLDLKSKDQIINEKEQAIRRAVLEHMSTDPKTDLTIGLILVSIVQDAERLGDLGKSIAKVADLAHRNRVGERVQELREIRDMVGAMFPLIQRGFVEKNVWMARSVMNSNMQVKELTSQYMHLLANDPTLSTNEAVVLTACARMIGRIGSHLSNIMSAVVLPFDQIRRAPLK